nr:DUF724 domain-containing protein 3 [Ipomoea trifida]
MITYTCILGDIRSPQSEIVPEKLHYQGTVFVGVLVQGPLTEAVPGAEIRPEPPRVTAAFFDMYEEVDAFDNDGWWVGKITGKIGSRYYVFFETTGDEILYHKDRIRVHLDWVHHSWVLTQPETQTQIVS